MKQRVGKKSASRNIDPSFKIMANIHWFVLQSSNHQQQFQDYKIPFRKLHPMLQLVILLVLAITSNSQDYPSCPGGSPLTVGNNTDPFNLHIIQLSTFLILGNSDLQLAFEKYLATGDDADVNEIISKNTNFYIIITVTLCSVSLVLFVMLARMGDLKFSQKQKFEELKQNGYSSPLSAFFTLIAVALLVFTCFAAYLIPSMISSLKMTECRLDSLNNALLDGSPQYDWDGISAFLQKMAIGSKLASSLETSIAASALSASDIVNMTSYARIYINEGLSLYNGVKDDYSAAQITYNDQNASQNIALTTLIPNLFESVNNITNNYILADLQAFLAKINTAMALYDQFQLMLNESYSILNTTASYFNQSSLILQSIRSNYLSRFISFRFHIASYFSSAEFSLIASQLLVGFTIIGCLVSIFTIRLIQANFDYFSLRVYKVIWACHIIVFCLNLISLLVAGQMLLYAQGTCSLAEQTLNNQTKLVELLPEIERQTGLGLLNACYTNKQDFTIATNTEQPFKYMSNFIKIKQDILNQYNTNSMTNFHQYFETIRLNLTQYKIGVNGVYPYVNQGLSKLNKILLTNPYNENCFKHHWQYHPSACYPNDIISILPKKPFIPDPNLKNTTFSSYPTTCYILSNYDSYYPHIINVSQFLLLYSNSLGLCNVSFVAMKSPICQFFDPKLIKQSVIDSLIRQVQSLQPYLLNGTYYLASYLSERSSFLRNIFSQLDANTNSDYFSKGNNCGIIGAMVKGIYNQFCINYRAQGRQVYLIILCNLAYSVLLILLSFLYALQLQSLNEGDEVGDVSERVHIDKKSGSSESDGSIADLISNSSSKSDQHK